ncbi:MAG: glycoside hydrolase family 28 protein [Bacteroidales bacterium]|nr:glycoside hydrolase family 28 protein [Bacteroidales bacterium]MBQ2530653.1 glycoside hydrolase family 28 protein [Bacteroidales bacterium]
MLFSGIVFLILSCTCTLANPCGLNVRSFGAKGDGKTLDTEAINQAIEAASASGGGTVYFPAGVYLSHSIHLKDHIRLFLDRGATLKAAVPDGDSGYDLPEPNNSSYQDFGHSHWKNSLIWGIGLEDLTIEGGGLIDGTDALSRGLGWKEQDRSANKAIALKECRNVTIRDIEMRMSGHFALLMTGVDHLTIDNVRVDTNRDAFDIDCCSDVHISNCSVNTANDDAIVLKSSYALGYLKPTENVTITDCMVSGFNPGTFLDGTYGRTWQDVPDRDGPCGRIKFGTESNGGFRNIVISNCIFEHCRGLALETVDGAVMEDITVSNILMRDIVNAPFYIRLGNRARGPEGMSHSVIRRIRISHVIVDGADPRYASSVFGLQNHPVEDVTFTDILIRSKGGLSLEDVMRQTGSNDFFNRDVQRTRQHPFDVPEQEKGYPEPSAHGILPAFGLFINHAKNMVFDHIVIETEQADYRPSIVLMDVEGIQFRDIRTSRALEIPFFVLKDVRGLKVSRFEGLEDFQDEHTDDFTCIPSSCKLPVQQH